MPDVELRKRIWRVLGGPGTVLVEGELAGLWRPAKKGSRLVVRVEALRRMTKAVREALAAEAVRLAPFRGADSADVGLTHL